MASMIMELDIEHTLCKALFKFMVLNHVVERNVADHIMAKTAQPLFELAIGFETRS